MNWLHRLAHFLGAHSTFQEMSVDDDGVYSGHRCNTCGKVERVIRMWPPQDSERHLKNLFGR